MPAMPPDYKVSCGESRGSTCARVRTGVTNQVTNAGGLGAARGSHGSALNFGGGPHVRRHVAPAVGCMRALLDMLRAQDIQAAEELMRATSATPAAGRQDGGTAVDGLRP